MISAVIIDDEKDARFLLRNQLSKNFDQEIEILGEADSVEAGIKLIKSAKPEVVFLDIKMPSGTGFDILQQLEEINFEVVFITAHDDYAVKAFQFSAFGYLLKPIKTSELKALVEKLDSHIQMLKRGNDQRFKVLIENYGDDRKIKKLVVTNMEGFQILNIEGIIRLEGDRNYTHFIMADNKKITTSKTIGEYEELLNEYGFYRIHQSTIINLRHVKGYKKGDEEVEMADGKLVKLSRYRKADFVKRFI
ncbi:MAG: DNA-binding response regulator [Bacteroidetes bacterium]|jgi:two-component system LytT family response regulator|nr:DNA-binding response regulator [Bacteroidota bacterium]